MKTDKMNHKNSGTNRNVTIKEILMAVIVLAIFLSLMAFYEFFPDNFLLKYIPIALLFCLVFFTLRVASDHQRFAVFAFGKFKGLKGPGVFSKWKTAEDWVKISAGDRGELVAPKLGKFMDVVLPLDIEETVPIGSFIRITGFKDSPENPVIQAMLDPVQPREIVCEKCGHKMTLY
jgi:hypothetical protein